MASDWAMVRVQTSTLAELERVRSSMLLADLMGLVELQRDPRHRVSLDQVIRRLIDFRDRHAARVRRSKAKRRAAGGKKPAVDPSAAVDGGGFGGERTG